MVQGGGIERIKYLGERSGGVVVLEKREDHPQKKGLEQRPDSTPMSK